MEKAVLKFRSPDLHMLSELEAALKSATRDALMQVGLFRGVFAFTGHG